MMMKRLICVLTVLAVGFRCFAWQADTVVTSFPDEYLDTVQIDHSLKINNYNTIGFNWGVVATGMNFNPRHHVTRVLEPGVWSVMFTHYEKMFDYLPYFGFTTGLAYSREGFYFEPKDGVYSTLDGSYKVRYEEYEIPLLAVIHADTRFSSFFANLGFYAGYRTSVERIGPRFNEGAALYDQRNSWFEWDRQYEYGVEGGAGLALIFSPIEFHVQLLCRYSWASLYEPNSIYNPINRPSDWEANQDKNSIYHRYAYPFDFMLTAGVHLQLGKRSGKTKAMLRKEAKSIVYDTDEENDI